MKKTLKRTCAVALALATTAGITGVDKLANTNKNMVFADTQVNTPADETEVNVLKISNYEKNVIMGSTFAMPTATFGGKALKKCVVVSPSGTETDLTTTEQKGYKFDSILINEIGTYTISYTDESGKFSGSVTFRSTLSKTTSILLDTNNEYVLPEVVGQADTLPEVTLPAEKQSDTKKMYIPTYSVKDKNGKDATDVTVNISAKDPNFKDVVVGTDADGVNYLDFGTDGLVEGTYTITYTVNASNGQFLTSTKKSFKVVKNNAYKTSDKLVLSYSKEKPESLNIGKEVELPGITAKIGTENVPVYYSIKVLKNGTTEVTNGVTEENGTYKFTASEQANFYKVEYTVTSALGLKSETTSFVIDTVEDSLNPTPIVVEPYTNNAPEKDKDGKVVNKDYLLPSTFDDNDIKILPIFAEDLGTSDPSEFKFKREIVNSSYDTIYTDEDNANKFIMFNYSGDLDALTGDEDFVVAKDKDGKAVELKAGRSYYVYYTATDKAGNKKTETYKFTVTSNFSGRDEAGKPVAPSVTINDRLLESIELGETIEIGTPTFSDNNDARLETSVYYQYYKFDQTQNKEVEITTGGENGVYYPELNENNKYVIDTSEAKEYGATSIKIFATAKNDAYYLAVAEGANDKDKFIGQDFVEVQLNSTNKGTKATIVSKINGTGKVDGQAITGTTEIVEGQEITLPSIVFWDDYVNTLDAEVSIYCTTNPGEENEKVVNYDAYGAMAIRNENTGMYYYSNAKFTAATAGVYTIAVRATDAAGNVAIQFLEYTVKEAEAVGALRFANIGLTDTTIELGQQFKLPQAVIEGKDRDLYNWQVRCKEDESTSTKYQLNKDRFVAYEAGEYTLQYFMYEDIADGEPVPYGDEVVEVKITVEDTTKPEIYVDWRTTIVDEPGTEDDATIVKTSPVAIESTYKKGTRVLLPMFSADDLSGIDEEKSMITIKNTATSRTYTIKFSEMADLYKEGKDGTRMYFNFNDDAEYTITYTVYDKQGNSDTKQFTIKVGDLESPEFEVDSKVVGEVKLGKDLDIDLTDEDVQNYFSILDNSGETIDKKNIKIKLTVDGTELENLDKGKTGKYRFNLASAGKYEMTFTVEDGAGNKSTHVETFEIASKSDATVNQTEVIGTVLIVVSVVVLAGVVVYFIVSKRKMDKLYK